MSNGTQFTCSSRVSKQTKTELSNPGESLIYQAETITMRHKHNQVGAASAIRTIHCPFNKDLDLQSYLCIAWRAPFTTYTFLFRPMLGADVTSTSSIFAATENIFWLSSVLFVVIMFMRNRRLAFFSALAPSLVFMSIYSVAAGAYEGNMGTAFRHKSLILWVVILLLASTIVATKERKTENRGLTN